MTDFADLHIDRPLQKGVVMLRSPDGLETNVPHLCVHHSPSGFEWGYAGSGPADLALNILEAALKERGHIGRREKVFRGDCFALAWNLHQDFKREIIAAVPRDGGNIPWATVNAFINAQAEEMGVCVGCGEDLSSDPEPYGDWLKVQVCPVCNRKVYSEAETGPDETTTE